MKEQIHLDKFRDKITSVSAYQTVVTSLTSTIQEQGL